MSEYETLPVASLWSSQRKPTEVGMLRVREFDEQTVEGIRDALREAERRTERFRSVIGFL